MADDIVIRAEGIGKKYVIGHEARHEQYVALRDVIARSARSAMRKAADMAKGRIVVPGDEMEEFWALKDINFEVKRGEVLGIIGRNGAGKSTLLKVLSRITEPTEGRITIKGRVASLLEVGTGFHPELTGRENVYLNGAILGMKRAEIKRKFDEIVAFAEVEKFLDTPVKRYSSGMYVRLAFAVAAHLEPEILIVDEVLAVGDAEFQKKCLGKMNEVASGGRTVLFVSHNMAAVLQLTSRALVLSGGLQQFDGATDRAVALYSSSARDTSTTFYDVENKRRKYLGTGDARITALWFNRPMPVFSPVEDLQFWLSVRAGKNISKLRVSMTVFAADGTPVGSSIGPEFAQLDEQDQCEIRVTLPHPLLAPGQYYCGVAIGRGSPTSSHVDYDVVLEVLHFEVVPEEGDSGTLSSWSSDWGRIRFEPLCQSQLPALPEEAVGDRLAQ